MSQSGRPEASRPDPPVEPGGFLAELWDAVSASTVLLVLGVLVLQLGFILSYVGAFHSPRPHRIPIAVVAPAQLAARVAGQLNALPAPASGLGGAVLGALTGHLLALWGLGTLLVLAAATVTMALQVLLGVFGIGATVLVFVVLGNPSAGGAYQPSLLPPFWRAISSALPNGAGTEAARRIVYFGSHGIGGQLLVISGYAVAGAIVTIGACLLRQRQSPAIAGSRHNAR